MTIGEFVKQYRNEHGLSMQAFGDMCGLSRAYISILEKGINPTTGKAFAPAIETLNKIALATNSNLDTLLQLIDGDEVVVVNASALTLSPAEKELIQNFRALSDEDKEEIEFLIEHKCKKTTARASSGKVG